MSENGFLSLSTKKIDYFNEPNLEIHITTLFGTIIDMKVSISDTIREIKQRIQRVEGIPMYQQNLVYQSKELKDCHRLCDIGIKNGSRLQLITAMKGGPMSTRRLTSTLNCDHYHLRELKELLETTRDEIEANYQQSNTKVSLLIFKNGDILNLLRVIENEDGTYSPYHQQNNHNNNNNDDDNKSSTSSNNQIFEKLIEDTDMMMKLTNLRRKMELLQLKRRYNPSRRDDDDDDNNKTIEDRLFGGKYKLLDDDGDEFVKNLKVFEKICDNIVVNDDGGELPDKSNIKSSLYSRNKGLYSYTKQNYAKIHKKANSFLNNNNNNSEIRRDDETTTDLPPVITTKRARCNQCNKRLNLTNLYDCRCGKIYCSIHRYPELHQCNYDFKNEGRNLLKTQNPLIQAEKINKI